jgi:DNA-binding NtrC family response regulator
MGILGETASSPTTQQVRVPPSRPRVLALLPDAPREEAEDALGAPVEWCEELGRFLSRLGERRWAAALLSLEHPAVDETVAARVAASLPSGSLFLTSRERTVEQVVAAERAGSVALLSHPPRGEELRQEVRPSLEESGDLELPGERDSAEPGNGSIVGSSPELVEVFRVVARVAATPVTVLITGESGTGKELVARALHEQGSRRERPFVTVNCAAIPDTLLEAELFGFEKGAFTGAVAASEGRFGRAHAGTLFLDEIGELSLPLQAKILRVLETGEIERLGARAAIAVDVRVIAATNQPLRDRVASGSFREDLLYRLAIVEVEVPPLRRRAGDVIPLVLHFARRFSARYARPIHALSKEAVQRLTRYPWPGNVRELRNVVDRAVLLARGGVIRSHDVRLGADAPRTSPVEDAVGGVGYPPTMSLEEVEAAHIRRVLEHTRGRMGEAAEILGVHRNTITAKVREHAIDVDGLSGSR